MDKTMGIKEYFSGVETTEEHSGYFCSVEEALAIAVLGSLCGLRNISQVNQWAKSERVGEFLAKHCGVEDVPCYYWHLCLLKIVKPESLNQCMMNWVQSLFESGLEGKVIALDGKTIRSTGKMDKYLKPMHIISAHVAELGITLASHKVDSSANEIPALRELLEMLEIGGCMIVADAMHCQKETAAAIIDKGADYLLCAKGNQSILKKDIEDYVQDKELRETMDKAQTHEPNSGRIELRRAFVCHDIDWLGSKDEWKNLSCIGAINRQTTYKGKTTNEWHYYISSRNLTAEELLKYARLEWSVETMHWLLDVHFHEDFCRIEDEAVQELLNTIRKIALNHIKLYKQNTGSKLPLSKIMFGCLLDCEKLVDVLGNCGN